MIYVLHHADSDGRFGAHAAWKGFLKTFVRKEQIEKNVRFIEVQYGQVFPIPFKELTKQDAIYIVDFSYAREILDQVYELVNYLIVLDHHETAEKQLAGAPYAIFDKTKSGALIAWEFFHPTVPAPKVCKLVNDYDLWKKEYEPETSAFEAWIQFEKPGQDWSHWNKLTWDPEYLSQVIMKGSVLHAQNCGVVESFIKNTGNYVIGFKAFNAENIDRVDGYTYAVYNGNTILRNEIAEALYTKYDLDLTIQWRVRGNEFLFSVRATRPEKKKASDFCAEFPKGGGNPKAGGFALPLDEGFALVKELMEGKN